MSARSPVNIDTVRDSVDHSPRQLLWRRKQEFAIPHKSIRGILFKDLHLYLYKIQIKYNPTQEDMEKLCGYVLLALSQDLWKSRFLGWSVVFGWSSFSSLWTQRITTSGAQPHLKIVGKVQYIPSSVKHGLPSRSMEGSDYMGYFGRFEQRWADQEELTEMNNASLKKEPLSYLIWQSAMAKAMIWISSHQ